MEIGEVGKTVIARGLAAALENDEGLQKEIYKAWERYKSCDWGNLGEEDQEMNNNAVKEPRSDRILARYSTTKGDIYIITEWDRSYTTFMFCTEY